MIIISLQDVQKAISSMTTVASMVKKAATGDKKPSTNELLKKIKRQ